MDFSSLFSENTIFLQIAALAVVAIGAIVAFFGVASSLNDRSTAADRMKPHKGQQKITRTVSNNFDDDAPVGISAALIPSDASVRFDVGQALARSGFRGKNAIANFYFFRMGLAAFLPLAFLIILAWQPSGGIGGRLSEYVSELNSLAIVRNVAILCGIGYLLPQYWINWRIKERKHRIQDAFPNMLDLLQIGVEAGMGFDQALLKVGVEMQLVAPELSEEILVALSEIQAGRDREVALMRMARRTGIDEMSSFVGVVLQSARFGAPLSDALNTYAEEMRELRELRAQEKANKLPVQMSAVLAFLMLPAIAGLILTPIVIRYLSTF